MVTRALGLGTATEARRRGRRPGAGRVPRLARPRAGSPAGQAALVGGIGAPVRQTTLPRWTGVAAR